MRENFKIRNTKIVGHDIPTYKRSVSAQSRRHNRIPKKRRLTGKSILSLFINISPAYFIIFAIIFLISAIYVLTPFNSLYRYLQNTVSIKEPNSRDLPVFIGSSSFDPVLPFFPEKKTPPIANLSLTVMSGDSLKSLLMRYGFNSSESNAAQLTLDESKKELQLRSVLKAGENIEIGMNFDGILSFIKIPFVMDENILLRKTESGEFNFVRKKVQKLTREQLVIGTIESSFAGAAASSGLSYQLVDDLVDIFSDRISFHRDFRKGDRFSVIYHEHFHEETGKSSAGPILAAVLETNGQSYTAIRYTGSDGKARYFNEAGELIGNTFLRYPLKFSRISSHFSDGRMHPILKKRRAHNGVDFAAPTGTAVRAIGDGVVTFAGRKGGHGIMLEIKHTDRYKTGYSHLSAISKGIKRGKRITQGMVIGKVGMTGLATGPHLHFSLYDYGKYVDPLKAKLPKSEKLRDGMKINPHYLTKALHTLTHYKKLDKSAFIVN